MPVVICCHYLVCAKLIVLVLKVFMQYYSMFSKCLYSKEKLVCFFCSSCFVCLYILFCFSLCFVVLSFSVFEGLEKVRGKNTMDTSITGNFSGL